MTTRRVAMDFPSAHDSVKIVGLSRGRPFKRYQ
jgi:hypothetical protein